MPIGSPNDIASDTIIHRVGGGTIENLRLSVLDEQLDPPGISVLFSGTPQAAAEQMRAAFPRSRKWRELASIVGTITAEQLRQTGFEVIPDPTARFPNHARLIHPDGALGFKAENLQELAVVFQNTTGC